MNDQAEHGALARPCFFSYHEHVYNTAYCHWQINWVAKYPKLGEEIRSYNVPVEPEVVVVSVRNNQRDDWQQRRRNDAIPLPCIVQIISVCTVPRAIFLILGHAEPALIFQLIIECAAFNCLILARVEPARSEFLVHTFAFNIVWIRIVHSRYTVRWKDTCENAKYEPC